MAFSTTAPRQDSIATINITPLVDVMLVLLVIFMLSAPMLTRAVRLDLPQVAPPATTRPVPPPPIALRIDAAGGVSWNGEVTPIAALPRLMQAEAARDSDKVPVLQIDASAESDYGVVARVLAQARSAGLEKIGFVRQ